MGSHPFLLVLALVGVAQCANPNYSYHVKVEDPAHANFQEKAEARKGPDAVGFYSVVEPNGALRTVQYTANDDGFNPTVTYSYGGTSVYHNSGAGVSTVGTYAPAYVQDQRVQIVDKLTGHPPALNIQPFALPAPSLGVGVASGPVVVPAPIRAAPAPQLIAQAEGVEYAPAYMPPVSAFVERAPVSYAPTQVSYAPAPAVSYAPAPAVSYAPAYAPAPAVSYAPAYAVRAPVPVYGPPVRAYLPPPPPRAPAPVYGPPANAYLPPPPPPAVFQAPVYGPPPPPQPVKTYLPPPQVLAVEKPQVLLSLPKKPAVIAVSKAPVKVIDSYAAPPINTVTDYSGPVYPEAIRAKPGTSYGPPDFVPGKPLSSVDLSPAPAVLVQKPKTQVHVTVVQPAPEPQKFVQYAPAYTPVVQKVYQQAPVQVAVAAPVVQKVVHHHQAPLAYAQPVAKLVHQAPLVSAYAGAIGYHTQTSGPSSYLHSYGSPGFQVTSSRQYNKAVLTAPVVQQTYAPKYLAPAPAPVTYAAPAPVAYAAAPAPVAYAAPTYAAQAPVAYAGPVSYGAPAPAPVAVAAPAPVAVAPAPLAIAGKKQNPLTFQYSYDQGSAKVSHSYSGSGW